MYTSYRDPDVAFPEPVHSDLDVSHEGHQEVRRNYAAMVSHLDHYVGELLEKLKDRGELGETLIVFSSDHGEMLGDYGQWSKVSPLQPSVGVPLVISGPMVASRTESEIPVTTLDLHATFLDYAGLTPGDDIDSRSMKPFLTGAEDGHCDVVFSEHGPWRLAFDGRFKLIEGYNPELRYAEHCEPMTVEPSEAEELRNGRPTILYDVTDSERKNVIDEHRDAAAKLAARLADH